MQDLSETDSIEPLGGQYSAWLCDIWGVVHNGVEAYESAVTALLRYREQGGVVALITNAPRPSRDVAEQLAQFGVPSDAYDTIVSSGDVTRSLLKDHRSTMIFHLGPERDAPIYQGLELDLGDLEEAGVVLCTGLFDDTSETPDDYEYTLSLAADRKLVMICANPDKVVQRGENLIYCAGALADVYANLGGEVVYAGKPYAPIYDLARKRLAEFHGVEPARNDMLVIGDGSQTDLAGAAGYGVDAVFITGGIHARDMSETPENSQGREQFLSELISDLPKLNLIAIQSQLRW